MTALSLQQDFDEIQEVDEINKTICQLCEGSHGNNTLCQMSWSD